MNIRMFVSVLALVFGITMMTSASNVSPKDKSTYSGGKVVVANGGRYYEIIDNVNHVCIYIEIKEEKTSKGTFYTLMCENKVTKNIAKTALKGVVASVVGSSSSPVIGALAWDIAGGIYDEVCDYYGSN